MLDKVNVMIIAGGMAFTFAKVIYNMKVKNLVSSTSQLLILSTLISLNFYVICSNQ